MVCCAGNLSFTIIVHCVDDAKVTGGGPASFRSVKSNLVVCGVTGAGKYRTADEPFARGEIWLGGGNVAIGYYNNAEKTAVDFHVINGQCWFATGDIGRFEDDGCLRIIGK